jgi:hypothetical protein
VYNRSSEVCTDQERAAEEASARAKLLELYEALDGITVLDNASIRHGELLLTGITLPMTAYNKLLFRKKEILPESLFQKSSVLPGIISEALPVAADYGEPRARKGRQGRPGLLFRLNRKKYAAMKEDGGKLEF